MATAKPKEGNTPQKPKSISAPSTPRTSETTNGKSKIVNPLEADKTPHYLRPTKSSCNIACKHASETPAKRLTKRKSLDKLLPPSHSPVKGPTKTTKSPTTFASLKPVSDKPSKTINNTKPRLLSRTKSLPKGSISITKGREDKSAATLTTSKNKTELKEKALLADAVKDEAHIQHQQLDSAMNSSQQKTSEYEITKLEQHQGSSPKQEPEATRDGKEQQAEGSSKTGEGRIAMPKPHKGKPGANIMAAPVRLKFKDREQWAANQDKAKEERIAFKKGEAREESLAGNEVIEEAAKKLAERRNKVKALVGAFETVMSLHEPEGQHSPGQQSHHYESRHGLLNAKERKEGVLNQTKDEESPKTPNKQEKANEDVAEADKDTDENLEGEEGQLQKEVESSEEATVNVTTDDSQPSQHQENIKKIEELPKPTEC